MSHGFLEEAIPSDHVGYRHGGEIPPSHSF
jgi:hypothetical protein